MTNQVDIGNFWAWQNNAATWLNDDNANPTSTNKFGHGLWAHA